VAFTQDNRQIAIRTELGKDALLLRSVLGTEWVSQPFLIQLDLLAQNKNTDPSRLLGRPASITMKILGKDNRTVERHLHGLITSVVRGEMAGEFATMRAELRPALSMLENTTTSRIFQNETVPDIVQKILKAADVKVRASLGRQYTPREFCVQYRETSLNFVSRLLEEEGIFYYFLHGKDEHTMVLADDSSALPQVPAPSTISYQRSQGAGTAVQGVVTELEYRQDVPAAREFLLRDYTFTMFPKVRDLEVEKINRRGLDRHQVYDYPGGYRTASLGQQRVGDRLEATAALRSRVSALTSCAHLLPGHIVQIDQHAVSALNQSYVVLAVSHTIAESYDSDARPYSNQIEGIPKDVPYRPERRAVKPFVSGPQTALVVGGSGEELHVDKYGRIRVQFWWDRLGREDAQSSCDIRVAQPWAGANWGAIFLPRIGQEVVVEFEEGDPDRPLVTGSVYNSKNMPPYALPTHATRSTIKSNSSTGGGGFNELRFEDKAGAEQVYLHAQKDLDEEIEQDRRAKIGRSTHLTVAKDRIEQIGGKHHLKVGADSVVDVAAASSLKAGTTVVAEAGTEVYIKAGSKVVLEAGVEVTITAGGNFVKIDPSGVSIQGMMVRINSGGAPGSSSASSKTPDSPDAVKPE
jgi:type VI secretion system secreted protein VgrG